MVDTTKSKNTSRMRNKRAQGAARMKDADTIISQSPAEFIKIPLFKSLNYEELEDLLFKCVLLRIESESKVIAPRAAQSASLYFGARRNEYSPQLCEQGTRGDIIARRCVRRIVGYRCPTRFSFCCSSHQLPFARHRQRQLVGHIQAQTRNCNQSNDYSRAATSCYERVITWASGS